MTIERTYYAVWRTFFILLLFLIGLCRPLSVQAFIHPGGLVTLADLNRMKTNVLAGNHPWIDDWNVLITDPEAQSNYADHATTDMGSNRQNADADAHAAYLNTIRWYISGDTDYANEAVKICNDWSAAVNQVPSNTGLVGLPIMDFALAGELLRTYNGWQPADFASFTNMMFTYLYPACTNWVWNQPYSFAHWTSWDAPNNAAIIAIGVLCDNTNLFDDAVNRYQGSVSTAAISNAIPYLYGSLGQPEESGRDQEHCTLGIADLGVLCQVAWNQGLDLYGYANNRLLAGVEYLARYNLSHDVPYTALNEFADNHSGDHLFFISGNGHGRIDDRPVYEMFYNHYVVMEGLSAPDLTAMAQLYRPERGSADHFGYGTLTYTLNASASPYPPLPVPPAPTGLTAQAGLSKIILNWTPSPGNWAQGYNVLRSTTSGGPYTTVASWTANTSASYTDASVTAGTTYYYVVSANNQSGTSANSPEVSATPMTASSLPPGWVNQDLGTVSSAGNVQYSGAGDNTFIVTGNGTGIGGTSDSGFNYTYCRATNDFTIIARLVGFSADQMGLMMRGSLAANAAEVQFFMANNARESIFAYRNGNGANLNHYTSGDQFTFPPAWYKLVRSGNNFTAYQSDDGINWVTVQTATVNSIPASGYYVGLAINSGAATFDNVAFTNAAVTGTFAPPATPSNVAATALAANVVALSWNAVTNASGYNVLRGLASGGPYTNIVTDTGAVGAYDTSVAANTTYYYTVTAINGGGQSPNSSVATVTTPASSVPATPAYLTASPSATQIVLNWPASIGATSYNVKRSTTSGGPYSTIATRVVASYTDTNVAMGTDYFYVVSAVNASGESANSSQAVGALLEKLTGTIIGTAGSWGNHGNTKANVFDGNLGTYFDSPDASGDWCGLDFGSGVSNVIETIQYCPRAGYASRMVGGVFQGANDPNFTSPTTLFTVTATPADGVMTSQTISVTNAFRYVRYLGPNNANCNVAEIEFDGHAYVSLPSAPTYLLASAGDGQITLNWNSVSGAFGYNLKRSVVGGGPYDTIAAATAATNYTDTNVMNGVVYYYVVSAVNTAGESADSTVASARPVSTTPIRLNFTFSGGELRFDWPLDHTGWTLEAQTNAPGVGLGTNWVPIANSLSTNQLLMPVNAADGSVFFRLRYP